MTIVYTTLTMLKHPNSLENFTFSWKIEIDDTGWWGVSHDVHEPICTYILNDSN